MDELLELKAEFFFFKWLTGFLGFQDLSHVTAFPCLICSFLIWEEDSMMKNMLSFCLSFNCSLSFRI